MKLSDLDKQQKIRLSEGRGFLGLLSETGGVGKIVKGVNTTVDVKPGETARQAAKLGFKTSRDGVPPIASTNGDINPSRERKMGAKTRSHQSK